MMTPFRSEAAEKKCGPNEWYDKCGTLKACEDKCNEDENEERNEEACLSRACPGPGVCMCDPGFYRNKNGRKSLKVPTVANQRHCMADSSTC
ncbi:hypothetical protein ANCCAN_26865 [Ancylostoma caninum]|uniref:Uncharacterized protein n=1 Tax=Ancylostoma caninum TaxID=29170 RepID=A0A368F8Z6_ANCCA|nr:hypothetical protein ANCCAN_26865 [Ancylostoma caninum]